MLHGLEEHYGWFACRKVAFRDIFLSAERAAEASFKIHFSIHLDRRNIRDIVELLDTIHRFEDNIRDEVSTSIEVPRFIVGERLRAYESELR